MKRLLERFLKQPEKPLGRWCNVGNHPLCQPLDRKEENKRRREDLKKHNIDPYERLQRDPERWREDLKKHNTKSLRSSYSWIGDGNP